MCWMRNAKEKTNKRWIVRDIKTNKDIQKDIKPVFDDEAVEIIVYGKPVPETSKPMNRYPDRKYYEPSYYRRGNHNVHKRAYLLALSDIATKKYFWNYLKLYITVMHSILLFPCIGQHITREVTLVNSIMSSTTTWISLSGLQIYRYVINIEEGRKEMFYLTTHSTHCIYGYMASDIMLKDHSDSERENATRAKPDRKREITTKSKHSFLHTISYTK